MDRKLANSELDRKSPSEFKKSKKTPLIIILDNIRSLHNIGSVFRTADAFLVEKIYLCGITGRPPHRDITKTALGATESVAWEHHENAQDLIGKLKNDGVEILAVEQTEHAVSLENYTPEPDKVYAVIFGNEVKGVQQELVNSAHQVVEIPQLGTKHSLNISVSAGIVVWDLFSKLNNSSIK